MNAEVIVQAGPPGAGKTTTAPAIARRYDRAVHLHTDDFWGCIASGGIPPYLPESEEQNRTVMTVIREAAFAYAEGGFVTVVDGVVGPWMIDLLAPPTGRKDSPAIHYIVLRPDRAETLRRALARTDPSALVDEGPVDMMWSQFEDLGAFEDHVLDTTAQTPEETVSAVRDAISSRAFLLAPRG